MKESCAESLELHPGLNNTTYDDPPNSSLPPDTLSESDHIYVADPRLRKRKIPPCKPKVVIELEVLTNLPDTQVGTSHKSAIEEKDELSNEHDLSNLETECSSGQIDEVELGQHSDVTF